MSRQLRDITLSEWINLVAAIGTSLSAIFAYFTVIAANDQVKTALDVVNRGEKYKALAEFSAAAHASCRALIPPEIKDRVRVRMQEKNSAPLKPEEIFMILPDSRIKEEDKKKIEYKNARDTYGSTLESTIKAQALSVWIDRESERADLFAFVNSLPSNVDMEASEGQDNWFRKIGRAFSICENSVNKKMEDLIKR